MLLECTYSELEQTFPFLLGPTGLFTTIILGVVGWRVERIMWQILVQILESAVCGSGGIWLT
jgi:hypothetical protein